MKLKLRKRKREIVLHQHRDGRGNVFGRSHPVHAIHGRKKTREFHDLTLREEGGVYCDRY